MYIYAYIPHTYTANYSIWIYRQPLNPCYPDHLAANQHASRWGPAAGGEDLNIRRDRPLRRRPAARRFRFHPDILTRDTRKGSPPQPGHFAPCRRGTPTAPKIPWKMDMQNLFGKCAQKLRKLSQPASKSGHKIAKIRQSVPLDPFRNRIRQRSGNSARKCEVFRVAHLYKTS